MITIYLLRHGETIENAMGIFQGQMPGHLSDKGKEQARQMHEKVMNLSFDAVLCSDLQRCKDTASIVLEGMAYIPQYTDLLRERDMGNLVGKPIAGAVFDSSVEDAPRVNKRIRKFLAGLKEQYEGKTVLVISHGYYCRLLQAMMENKKNYKLVPKMDNCEIRRLEWE